MNCLKIAELKPNASNVEVIGKISEKKEVREVTTRSGKRLLVAEAVLSDDSGSILISLWGDDAKNINDGDTVKVTNGYVGEFKGKPQLSAGKYGKIEVIS